MKKEARKNPVPEEMREYKLIETLKEYGFDHSITTRTREIFTVPENPDLLLVYNTDRVVDESGNILLVTGEENSGKGEYTTIMQVFWLHQIFHNVENCFVAFGSRINDYSPGDLSGDKKLQKRCLIVKKMDIFPVDVTVHGYLTKYEISEYERSGTIYGYKMPPDANLVLGDILPEAVFTPSKKGCGEYIDFEQMVCEVGGMRGFAEAIRDKAKALYKRASTIAFNRGIKLTKSKIGIGTYFDEESGHWVIAVTYGIFIPGSSTFLPYQNEDFSAPEILTRYARFAELLVDCNKEEFWEKVMWIDL